MAWQKKHKKDLSPARERSTTHQKLRCIAYIAELFGLSVSFAYRVVERMNADLASKNYYVILGRVPTRYVEDKIYGLEHVEQYLKEDKAI